MYLNMTPKSWHHKKHNHILTTGSLKKFIHFLFVFLCLCVYRCVIIILVFIVILFSKYVCNLNANSPEFSFFGGEFGCVRADLSGGQI